MRAALGVHLAHQVMDLSLDRSFRKDQSLRHGLVRQPSS